jgi:hypothetical protein
LKENGLDALAAHFFQEIGVADLVALCRATVELLEHGEQHKCYHQPNSDLRKPLIVHRGSFFISAAQRVGPDMLSSTVCVIDSRLVKGPQACIKGVFRPRQTALPRALLRNRCDISVP